MLPGLVLSTSVGPHPIPLDVDLTTSFVFDRLVDGLEP